MLLICKQNCIEMSLFILNCALIEQFSYNLTIIAQIVGIILILLLISGATNTQALPRQHR
jgi:hypothetical protein